MKEEKILLGADRSTVQAGKTSRCRISPIIPGIVALLVLGGAIQLGVSYFRKTTVTEEKSDVSNRLRELSLVFFEFKTEYGRFPDATTSAAVKAATESKITFLDTTSNDLLAQLLVSGIATSEVLFHTDSKGMRSKVDNVYDSDSTILQHGECSFAYIPGAPEGAPVLFGPVIPGTKLLDVKAWNGEAVVLRGNTISFEKIDSSGKVLIQGEDMLSVEQPYWGGKTPDVKWPK